MGTYLNETVKFDGQQIGLAYGSTALAAMISPFFVGMIADRFFATEKLLAVLHLLGGLLLFYVASLTSFGIFYAVLIAYTLCYMPTLALTNSLSFHQMTDPGKEFPGVRVLGTIGWIVASLVIDWLDYDKSAGMFIAAAVSSLVLGVFCFTLPHTPPSKLGHAVTIRDILGLDALALMKNRSFAIFILGSFLVCIPLQFYYAFTNAYMSEIGVANATSKMTLGQFSEIGFMLVMPLFFARLGVKKMLLIGMAAWMVRYVLFAYGVRTAPSCGCSTSASSCTASATTSSSSPARSTSTAKPPATSAAPPRASSPSSPSASACSSARISPASSSISTASKARSHTTGSRSGSCPPPAPPPYSCCSPLLFQDRNRSSDAVARSDAHPLIIPPSWPPRSRAATMATGLRHDNRHRHLLLQRTRRRTTLDQGLPPATRHPNPRRRRRFEHQHTGQPRLRNPQQPIANARQPRQITRRLHLPQRPAPPATLVNPPHHTRRNLRHIPPQRHIPESSRRNRQKLHVPQIAMTQTVIPAKATPASSPSPHPRISDRTRQ